MLEKLKETINEKVQGTIIAPETENINSTERIVSVAAGAYLLFNSINNLKQHPLLALQKTLAAGYLLYRGTTGYCALYKRLGRDTTDLPAIRINETLVVNSPRELVYRFWRNFENLPKFMKHLKSVSELDDRISHWKANVPGNMISLDWTAEITKEEENRYIGWNSVAGSQIDNAGKIEFSDAGNGTGTQITVEINYFPPAGAVGRGIAKIFNGVFEDMVREDILQFKHFVESEEYSLFTGNRTSVQ